jgi:hypothetical protein
MVSAVNNNQSSQSIFAPPPAQPGSSSQQSSSSSSGVTFQQAVNQYTQDTTSGVGGGTSASGANPSQTLSSDLMSSLLAMQS